MSAPSRRRRRGHRGVIPEGAERVEGSAGEHSNRRAIAHLWVCRISCHPLPSSCRMAVTLKTVPPTVFVMSSHEGVTIPEISAVSRGVVDDMIVDLQAHGVMPLAPVHFIYHGADGSLTTQFRLTIAFP